MGLCNILAMKLAYLEEMALCYKFHTTQQGNIYVNSKFLLWKKALFNRDREKQNLPIFFMGLQILLYQGLTGLYCCFLHM